MRKGLLAISGIGAYLDVNASDELEIGKFYDAFHNAAKGVRCSTSGPHSSPKIESDVLGGI